MADKWASPQAEEKAGELDVSLEEVEGTGADGAATVKDVEGFAEARDASSQGPGPGPFPEEIPPETPREIEKQFYASLNPALGDITSIRLGARMFLAGERRPENVVTESEFKRLNQDYPGEPLVKGREV